MVFEDRELVQNIERCFTENMRRLEIITNVIFCSKHAASAFTVARHYSQTWPATGLDPPSTRSQPPQRSGSSGMCFTQGAGYMVNLLWIQDMSLKDWLLSDHGHGNPGRNDLVRSNSLDLTVTRCEPLVQPIGTWRRMGTYADCSLADVHWARKQKVRAVAAVENGIDYWRRHLPHDHPAALLAPASASPTPLHTPTAFPAFPPLPPVGLAQAPILPIPKICGSLANEIVQLRREIDERLVLTDLDGLLRRVAARVNTTRA